MDGGIQSSRLPTPEGRWRFYISGRTKERGRDVMAGKKEHRKLESLDFVQSDFFKNSK